MELMIWSGGRWRRVSASGRVEGWRRRARVLTTVGGELKEVSVRALRNVRRGRPLPVIRNGDTKARFKVPKAHPSVLHHRYKKCKKFKRDASVQTDAESEFTLPSRPTPKMNANAGSEQENITRKPQRKDKTIRSTSTDTLEAKTVQKPQIDSQKSPLKSPKSQINSEQKSVLRSDEHPFLTQDSTYASKYSTQSENCPVKELIIDEDDVMLLRDYIVKNNTKIDLYKFDSDEQYKMHVFFKINPLVIVERCPKIGKMLQERNDKATMAFAKKLGLKSAAESNSEQEMKRRRVSKRLAKTIQISSDSDESLEQSRARKNDIELKRKRLQESKITNVESSDSEQRRKSGTEMKRMKLQVAKMAKISIDSSDSEENLKQSKERTFKRKLRSAVDSDSEQDKIKRHQEPSKTAKVLTDSSDSEVPLVQSKERVRKRLQDSDSEQDKGKGLQVSKVVKVLVHSKEKSHQKQLRPAVDSDSEQGNRKGLQVSKAAKPLTVQSKKSHKIQVTPAVDSDSEQDYGKGLQISEKIVKALIESSDSDVNFVDSSRKRQRVDSDVENRRPTQPVKEAMTSQGPAERRVVTTVVPRRRPGFVPRRPGVQPGREYSSLEDLAIVSWLSAASERECAVNGNAVWRELEGSYTRLTGMTRTWHSLRNRYLRYILPALHSLSVPPHDARRLRAHAARGCIKSRRPSRRNSALYVPPVLSAHARRPRRDVSSPTSQHDAHTAAATVTQSEKRTDKQTRSNPAAAHSPPSSPARRELRSSLRQRHTPHERQTETKHPGTPSPRRARASSPTYAEVTRRFALRHRSTPQDTSANEGAKPSGGSPRLASKRRRLYNPAV